MDQDGYCDVPRVVLNRLKAAGEAVDHGWRIGFVSLQIIKGPKGRGHVGFNASEFRHNS